MNLTSARLLLLSGRTAYGRLVAIVAGVGVGVAMLLILLGAYLHLPDRDDRAAWRVPYGDRLEMDANSQVILPEPAPDAIAVDRQLDVAAGTVIDVVTVASSPGTTVTLPSGDPVPAPGRYFASPAAIRLIDSLPADHLEDRYGTRAGVIPDDMLTGPSQVVVVTGHAWDDTFARPFATLQQEFASQAVYSDAGAYRVILAIGAIALLVPIALLVSVVSQLGAAERRESFATVRLIGTSRRAVGTVAGMEMAVTAAIGAVLGLAVMAVLRPWAAQLEIAGSTSFSDDLTPPPMWILAVVIIVPALASAAAWWRTFRDDVGAPGASRERPEKPVTARRTMLLLAGIAMFGGGAAVVEWGSGNYTVASLLIVGGFAAIAFGIVVAGPWFTRFAARAFGAITSHASGVVAAGRLSRHPRATYRSVAGLVVAVFIVSVFAGGASAIADLATARDKAGALRLDAVVARIVDDGSVDDAVAAVESTDGVDQVIVGRVDPDTFDVVVRAEEASDLGATAVPDAEFVRIDLATMLADSGASNEAAADPPTAADGPGESAVRLIAITDGSDAAVERAKTAMTVHTTVTSPPTTRAEAADRGATRQVQELSAMAYLGMAIAIGLSAVALTVATVSAAVDRRRTFGLLRLAGMPLAHLRRTVVTEAAVPLAATVVGSAALGFGVAWVIVDVLGNGLSMTWPDPMYWISLAISVALAALAVSGSFGTVRRSTEVQSTRFE